MFHVFSSKLELGVCGVTTPHQKMLQGRRGLHPFLLLGGAGRAIETEAVKLFSLRNPPAAAACATRADGTVLELFDARPMRTVLGLFES